MRILATVLTLAAAAALSACGVPGSGDYGVVNRTVADFDRVEVDDGIHVYLDIDSRVGAGPVTLTVSGDDNLLTRIDTWVTGSTLHVQSDGALWEDLELRVSGSVGYLGSANVDNEAHLYADAIYGSDFVIHADDSAHAVLNGWVDNLDVYANDFADIDAAELNADYVWVDLSNSADVSVCANLEVSGYITSWADLSIYCNPYVIDVYEGDIFYY